MQRITRRNQKYRTEEEKPVEQPNEEQKKETKESEPASQDKKKEKELTPGEDNILI